MSDSELYRAPKTARMGGAIGRALGALLLPILLLLRPLFVTVGRFVAGLVFLCALAYGHSSGWTSRPCWILLAVSMLLAAIAFYYDQFLDRLGGHRLVR